MLMVVEAGNRLQLSDPTMVTTPLTYLIFARLFRKNKESRSRARALLACSSDCCFTRVEVIIAFLSQIMVAPLRLRNLLVGHTGEASLRPVENKCILVQIEVIARKKTDLLQVNPMPQGFRFRSDLQACRLACLPVCRKSRLEHWSRWNTCCHRQDRRHSTIAKKMSNFAAGMQVYKTANTSTTKGVSATFLKRLCCNLTHANPPLRVRKTRWQPQQPKIRAHP